MARTPYSTFVFDCDGVVLDSNRTKTEAFRTAASPWGKDAADALVAHHVANGGVSRYEKFRHFFEKILPDVVPQGAPGRDGPDLQSLLETYARAAREGLLTCSVADGIKELRAATPQARWMIVSGGDQDELRDVFEQRGLAPLFDGGIFGSPVPKMEILEHQVETGGIRFPAVFLGDSRLDHQAATVAGLDFIFVSNWTEVADWKDYVERNGTAAIPNIRALLDESTLE